MKFEVNLDHASLPKGNYQFEIEHASLFDNGKGWLALSLALKVISDGPFYGSKESRLIGLPDPSNGAAYKFAVEAFGKFMSAVAGSNLDGEVNIEFDDESKELTEPDLVGQTFWSYYSKDGQYAKWEDLVEEPTSSDDEEAPY